MPNTWQADIATYQLKGWRGVRFIMNILPKGEALRVSVEHSSEGVLKFTNPEARQLMEALMHHFNVEIPK